jgi:protein-L-isoaspartate(D-aspartate) O-methyltransferase
MDPLTGAVVTPIYQTTTFAQDELGGKPDWCYSRTGNPSRSALESSLAAIEGLQKRARTRLKELDIRNVRFKVGDGSLGWRSQAPFDGILVAAAPLVVPEELIEQLAVGGRLVVPAGPEGNQQLLRIVRREQGLERQVLGAVSFVPLVGGVG